MLVIDGTQRTEAARGPNTQDIKVQNRVVRPKTLHINERLDPRPCTLRCRIEILKTLRCKIEITPYPEGRMIA